MDSVENILLKNPNYFWNMDISKILRGSFRDADNGIKSPCPLFNALLMRARFLFLARS